MGETLCILIVTILLLEEANKWQSSGVFVFQFSCYTNTLAIIHKNSYVQKLSVVYDLSLKNCFLASFIGIFWDLELPFWNILQQQRVMLVSKES